MAGHVRLGGERREFGQGYEICVALWDGPRTIPEILEHIRSYFHWLGLYIVADTSRPRQEQRTLEQIGLAVNDLVRRGWVTQQGERYALTPLGRREAAKPLADMERNRARLYALVQPQTVSKVSLAVHLGLAAIKLPAGLISGSAGLLSDAADTLLDGFSSLLVYLGLRLDKERAVNVVLVFLMLATSVVALYEAARRLFVPSPPQADWFAFAAALLSGLVCAGLGLYQRFVGLRSGSMVLITQSVDSRNHVIVAASVTAGLVAALLRFALLDTLVGLAVGALILRSAVELAIDLVRAQAEGEAAEVKLPLVAWYEQLRRTQFRDWLLYLVQQGKAATREDLVSQAAQALDFSRNPMLRAAGVEQPPAVTETVEQALGELFDQGWLSGEERLAVTAAGRERLRRWTSEPRRRMRRMRGHRAWGERQAGRQSGAGT